MSGNSKVLVLVADEKCGTLCANSEGNTRLLRCIDRVTPSNDSHTSQEARHIFACELMMALGRDAGLQDYDGVIIYAEEAMMEELRQVQTGVISRLLIAQIVGRPTPNSYFPGRPANAQMAYRAVAP
jgi:hypothetical protein